MNQLNNLVTFVMERPILHIHNHNHKVAHNQALVVKRSLRFIRIRNMVIRMMGMDMI